MTVLVIPFEEPSYHIDVIRPNFCLVKRKDIDVKLESLSDYISSREFYFKLCL